MAASKEMVKTPATSATGTIKRTVSDQLRRLNPALSPFLSLVKSVNLDKMGKPSYGSGMIEKQATDHMKFEWFTETPLDIYHAVATDGTDCAVGEHTGTAIMASNANFRTRDIVTNLRTLEVAVVNTLTSTTTITVTAVTATWTTDVGDIIAMSCRTMEEGTDDITPISDEPTNNYNFVFPFRYVVSIADTATNSPHFTEQPLERYMVSNTMNTMRQLDNAFLLGERAASGNTTSVTIATVAYAMYTTRGLINYASNPFPVGGNMTLDKWNTDFADSLPETQDPSRTVKMACGKYIYNRLMNMAAQKQIIMESGEKDSFGVRVKKFFCGAYTIEPVMSDLFNQGTLSTSAIIFDPSDLVYRFKKGMDIRTVADLQTPATWGKVRGIQGVCGLQCWSGGANVKLITGWEH